MVYNQSRLIHAPIHLVWPWILQLGKGRGGWYLTERLEWWMPIPRSWYASREIREEWQGLKVGDRVEDYGFDKEGDWFDVVEINAGKGNRRAEGEMGGEGERERGQRWLVYRSDRMGTSFTWALILTDVTQSADSRPQTMLHLRFRGNLASTGVKRWLILKGGGFMDWISTAPMMAGLAERAERMYEEERKGK